MSQCITCDRFTMKPRTGEGEAHLTASDRAHARVGMGRCLNEALAMRWISGEAPACQKHEPVGEEKAAQRREWIKGKRA